MLYTKKKKKRFNIVLDESMREYLASASKERGVSASEFVRELVEDDKKRQKELQLEQAALRLVDEYKTNKELTAFTALDGEEFL